jgi:hypothetical protein
MICQSVTGESVGVHIHILIFIGHNNCSAKNNRRTAEKSPKQANVLAVENHLQKRPAATWPPDRL